MTDRITSPFGAFTPAREVVAGHDLGGKTAIVTGAATGSGIETARARAEAGADGVIAARKPDLAAAAIADIDKTAPGKTRFEMLDLSELASIRAFAARWGGKPLHILINNAAVMASPELRVGPGWKNISRASAPGGSNNARRPERNPCASSRSPSIARSSRNPAVFS